MPTPNQTILAEIQSKLPIRPVSNDPWQAFYPRPDRDGKLKPVWTDIDPNLTPTLRAAIDTALAARKLANEAEAEVTLEWQALMSDPPEGYEIKTGFMWGKAGWALVNRAKAKAVAKAASYAPLMRR